MKHTSISLLLIFSAILLCFSCSKRYTTKEEPNNPIEQTVFHPEKNGYQLVWEDQFNGNQLDTAKWKYRQTGPRRIGFNDPSMVKVAKGNLLLMYDIKGDSVIAGMIGTQQTFMNDYGYYECRASMPKCPGPWAAFWIQSPKIFDGADPGIYGTEIDIFEYFKEMGPNVMTHCLHWAYGPNMKSSPQLVSHVRGLSKGFHTFGLEWTKDKYAFYIDGQKYHEQTVGISHIKEYIILSMEIPAKLENLKNACAPDTFKVDYVKVYKKRK
jgi:beta-glucanase (GH16 family)